MVGETELGGTDWSLHEEDGKDWKASERSVRRGGSHLSALLPQTQQRTRSTLCSILPHPQSGHLRPQSPPFPQAAYFRCPVYNSFSEAGFSLLEDGGMKTKWDSFTSLEGSHSGQKLRDHTGHKENSVFFPALPQLTQAALGKTPVSQQFLFPICETGVHWVIGEKCSHAKGKAYYCNFFVFDHKERCSALSVFIFPALIFITGESLHDLKFLLETTAGKEP